MPPLPPEPQPLAATEISPLLSVCKHLVPKPLSAEEMRLAEDRLLAKTLPTDKLPMLAVLARKLVVEARPETYRLVLVAFELVAFCAVKSCKVEEPVSRRLLKVPKMPVRKPIKLVFALKSVVEARPETKRFVDVALVEVEFCAVKLVIVDEALTTDCAT